jgi:nicotinate-nucleotide--dimethylbenzimidazole phosphoribosyltransferase
VVVADLGVAVPLPRHPDLRDCKVAPGTADMTRGPAMTPAQCAQAIDAGIALVDAERARGADLIGTGEMGIGNTTAASAIVAALTGASAESVTGPGTGVDAAGRRRKVEAIRRALEVNRPDPADALDTLAKVGGFEIAGLVGVILAGAAYRLPVVLDGFIAGAAALAAVRLKPDARGALLAAHRSAEPGHARVLDALGLEPYLDLGLRLGEGTGAALCIGLARAAVAVLIDMATFKSAGISDRPDMPRAAS